MLGDIAERAPGTAVIKQHLAAPGLPDTLDHLPVLGEFCGADRITFGVALVCDAVFLLGNRIRVQLIQIPLGHVAVDVVATAVPTPNVRIVSLRHPGTMVSPKTHMETRT